MRIKAACRTHKGLVRENNEDNFYLNGVFLSTEQAYGGWLANTESNSKQQVYAVCDGMGGLSCGAEAAFFVVSRLKDLNLKWRFSITESIRKFIQSTNKSCFYMNQGNFLSGCTIAMVCVWGQRAWVVHVGDSRVYLLNNSVFEKLTIDHTQAQWYIDQGIMATKDASLHPERHVLRQYIGMEPEVNARIPSITKPISIKKGDIFLICSDGLTDMVPEIELDEMIRTTENCSHNCRKMVDRALDYGGCDNVTAMLIKVEGL